MTKELKNAVSRLCKLQDAVIAGKIDQLSVNISLAFYNHQYESGDHSAVDVTVSIFNEYNEVEKHLMFSMSDSRCYQVGSKSDEDWSIADILHEIAVTVDYPV